VWRKDFGEWKQVTVDQFVQLLVTLAGAVHILPD